MLALEARRQFLLSRKQEPWIESHEKRTTHTYCMVREREKCPYVSNQLQEPHGRGTHRRGVLRTVWLEARVLSDRGSRSA